MREWPVANYQLIGLPGVSPQAPQHSAFGSAQCASTGMVTPDPSMARRCQSLGLQVVIGQCLLNIRRLPAAPGVFSIKKYPPAYWREVELIMPDHQDSRNWLN